jgi:hypothetical protein
MNKILRQKFLSIVTTLALLINIVPLPVLAVAPETSGCIENDACFYSTSASQDTICDPTLGGAAGTGPLYGPLFPKVGDTKRLSAAILAYLQKTKPNSPYNTQAYADMFVAKGITYDVNPALAIAQLQVETSLGTVGHALPPKYNAFNVRNGPGGSFGSYPGYEAAMEAYYSLIKRVYTGPPSNITSVQALINKYAPPSDGNNVSQYLSTVNQIMTKILGGLEASPESTDTTAAEPTEPSTDTATNTTATSSCGNVGSAGELGWNITGDNKMVSYDQTDPKYSSHPYGKNADGSPKSPIGESGCGPSSVAMVVATLTGKTNITPITIADRYGDRYHGSSGSDHALFKAAADDYGLAYEALGTDLTKAAQYIKDGGLVIISVNAGHFTGGGHIMVIRAITQDGTGFYLNDPNGDGINNDSETRSFDAAFLSNQGKYKGLWGYKKK